MVRFQWLAKCRYFALSLLLYFYTVFVVVIPYIVDSTHTIPFVVFFYFEYYWIHHSISFNVFLKSFSNDGFIINKRASKTILVKMKHRVCIWEKPYLNRFWLNLVSRRDLAYVGSIKNRVLMDDTVYYDSNISIFIYWIPEYFEL